MLFQCVAAVCLLSRAFDGRWAMVKALLAHAQAEGAVPEKKKGFAADGSGAQTAVAQRQRVSRCAEARFRSIVQ